MVNPTQVNIVQCLLRKSTGCGFNIKKERFRKDNTGKYINDNKSCDLTNIYSIIWLY